MAATPPRRPAAKLFILGLLILAPAVALASARRHAAPAGLPPILALTSRPPAAALREASPGAPAATSRPSLAPGLSPAGPSPRPSSPSPSPTSRPAATAGVAWPPTQVAGERPAGEALGFSAGGRPILAYRFGSGPVGAVFVGGIHGGYEWNTILLAYQALDYFAAVPPELLAGQTLYIIPSANPDGQQAVAGTAGRFTPDMVAANSRPGRFNANGVDLNRNWECDWSARALWGDEVVSAGSAPFSEPESRALRDFFLALRPAVVVFWHSSLGGVFGSGCDEPSAPSWRLAQLYAQAAGYPAEAGFSAYPVTGDASDWLAAQGIPSFSVELTSHESVEWAENLAGMLALLAALRGG
jgi:hypothetical protein